MADDSDRLADVEELPHERHRAFVGAQLVGVGHPAGQDQRIEVIRRGILDLPVHVEFVGTVQMVEGLNRAIDCGHQRRMRTGLGDRAPRFDQLDLLDTLFRHQKCDPSSFQRSGHDLLSSPNPAFAGCG